MTDNDPFLISRLKNGQQLRKVDAASRIEAVKTFSVRQCVDAINLPEVLQKSVRQAIQRRIAQLDKQRKTQPEQPHDDH